MRGFPNRMPYPEFISRYYILEPNRGNGGDPKKATEAICNSLIDKERFRVGHTKIFFR